MTAISPSIDRDLLRDIGRNFDRTEVAAPPAQETAPATGNHVDISGVLEAVRFTASSLSGMAERIREFEAHIEALEQSHEEFETQRQQLAAQLEDVDRQHKSLAAGLKVENERVRRLENLAAQHGSRAAGLERDLGLALTDLGKIVEAVGAAFGSAASSQHT